MDGIDRMIVGMALLPDGFDFDALDGQPTTVVFSHFVYNAKVDEKLFSVAVPKGYQVVETENTFSAAERSGKSK